MALLNYVKKITIPSLGELVLKEGSSTFKPGGHERTFQSAEHAGGGYTEAWKPAELDVVIQPLAGEDLADLQDLTNENITIVLANGDEYLMSDAWLANQLELSKGELKATFNSQNSEKVS